MSFQEYAEYRASDTPWLGPVPSHWRVDRLKRSVATCKNGVWGDDPQGDENDIACVRVADFDREKLIAAPDNPTIRNVESSELRFRRLQKGDLLLEKSGGGEKQPVGCVVLYEGQHCATCANFIARIELASEMSPSFWRYVHATLYSANLNKRSIKQTSGIQNIDQQAYLDERVAFPPSEEQRQIADFLDHETARIDALIEEQQRLIELLREKRKASVSAAVTIGLDRSLPTRDSGVEWIGRIPEHWRVERVGMLFADSYETGRADLPVLSVSLHHGVSDSELSEEEADRKLTRIADREKYKRVRPGDLVYNMMRAWQGAFGAVSVDGLVSPAYVVARPKASIHTGFLEQQLRSPTAIEEMRRFSYGITDFRLRLYWDSFKDIRVALPPEDEQQQIMEEVERIVSEATTLTNEARRNIALLKERRSALISAAVTGKIDVRDWSAQHTAETGELSRVAEPEQPYG